TFDRGRQRPDSETADDVGLEQIDTSTYFPSQLVDGIETGLIARQPLGQQDGAKPLRSCLVGKQSRQPDLFGIVAVKSNDLTGERDLVQRIDALALAGDEYAFGCADVAGHHDGRIDTQSPGFVRRGQRGWRIAGPVAF